MIPVASLPDKTPYEIVGYVFNMSKYVPVGETFSTHTYAIYDEALDPNELSDLQATMFYAKDFSNTARTVECDIQAGTDAHTYILKGRVVCTSGLRYEFKGRFHVREIT